MNYIQNHSIKPQIHYFSWTQQQQPNHPIKPTILKPFTLTTTKTSFKLNHHQFQEQRFDLPIITRHSGKVSNYSWDGNQLKIVTVNGINAFSLWDLVLDFESGVKKLGKVCGVSVRNFFMPREVSESYVEYVKWKLLHRVFSSALQVLATQAMFRAIGIGYRRSLPSAAALNWVLKDGLGRLGRCIYTASLASDFDTNLKRVRFLTSVIFSLSIGVELLTPIFPKHFLLLATIANIAKQISLSCYLATGSAVHRSFAIADNLGEVSAKGQIQTVCFDNIGLLLAASLNILLKDNPRLLACLPFAVYPLFATLDLLGIYQGLKHVHLQTLTKDRLESIINTLIQQQYVPTPAEVSKREDIHLFWKKGKELLPIRIGSLNPKRKMSKLSVMSLKCLKEDDQYFLCMESLNGGSRLGDYGILLCLREGAGTSDIIMGLLQACYIRKNLLGTIKWEDYVEPCDSSDSVCGNWLLLMEVSRTFALDNLGVLNDKMSETGWASKNILLSSREQARYNFVTN